LAKKTLHYAGQQFIIKQDADLSTITKSIEDQLEGKPQGFVTLTIERGEVVLWMSSGTPLAIEHKEPGQVHVFQ
jgi:hypothetical protein